MITRKVTWRMRRWRMMPVRRRNDDVEGDGVEQEDRSRDRGNRFVRAGAVDMHLDMSQKPFDAKMRNNNGGGQVNTMAAPTPFARVCASEKHVDISQEPLIRKFIGKRAGPRIMTQTLCTSAQLTCTWIFQKIRFIRTFKGKRPHVRSLIKNRPLLPLQETLSVDRRHPRNSNRSHNEAGAMLMESPSSYQENMRRMCG